MTRNFTKNLRLKLASSLLALGLATSVHANGVPFKITVDGQEVTGSTLPSTATTVSEQNAVVVDVKFDGLGVAPILNVSTVPMKASFASGDTIGFLASLNYGAWIDKAEIRIYRRGNRKSAGLIEVVAIDETGTAEWAMPSAGPAEMEYVLRVYDADGRYDETSSLPLSRVDGLASDDRSAGRSVAPGYAEDRTAVRNIDVHGGVITVNGSNVPEGHDVYVMGELVPVDGDGKFVTQRIMPQGSHHVEVKVSKEGQGLDFSRTIEIPESEWFYVGLADFTLGKNFSDKVEALRPGEFDDDVYTRGRLAFYLKGKIQGRYILTAAADTGESRLKSIFKGLDEKDPRQFLKRLDPDDYYPVYGDDSTAIEDAPTRGKFYVRLEKGPSHVMWGNFKSNISGTKFLRNERALYGAQAVYRSNAAAPDGGAKTAVDLHAAMPGTVPSRDIFRGTGGSAYFVKHQDVTPGSDTVSIEVRNTITGWVVERRTLKFGSDYDFDYVQGVILLREPLNSSESTGTENYLIANYEFTPAAADVDGYVVGGRAQQWLGDNVRVGVTAMREKTQGADQKLIGADVRLQKSDGTFIEAEVAQSDGPGFGSTYSPDGGLTLQDNASVGAKGVKARAFRLEGRVALEDLSPNAKGSLGAHYEKHEAGFSSLDVQAKDARTLIGAEADIALGEKAKLAASISDEKIKGGSRTTQALGKLRINANDHVAVEPYGAYTRKTGDTSSTVEQGQRGDVGVKILYAWDDSQEAFIFGQATVKRTGTMTKDHRAGAGGSFRLSDKVKAEGEVSYGTQGAGAAVRFSYEPTADNKYYIGYKLDPSRDIAANWPFQLVGEDIGTIVAGTRHRFNDQWSAYAEDNMDLFGKRRSLTQVYGVTYTPDAAWTINAGSEIGQVFDNTFNPATGDKNPDFDRIALSTAVAYKTETGIDGALKGEWRIDDSEDDARDMESYLLQASLGVKFADDWRAVGTFDGVITSSTTSTREGAYAEGSLGFAYRPLDNDRINGLAKYTYLYDLPGDGQVSVDGTSSSPAQRSHIFSGDISYDIIPQLTLGAKYGVRIGETRDRVAGSPWIDSQVHLAVLRADLHIVKQWDAVLEGRMLWSPTTDEKDFGVVAAIYRQFGDNMKAGIGYNFGRFSDDVRDLTQDDHGIFFNVIGKF